MNETWLAHHGIKGQKWGVRRFQNPDGTLTEAGKKRQLKDERKEIDRQRTSMSDKDLDEHINRIKKENQLHDLINPGKAYVKNLMSTVGSRVLTTAITGAALYAAKALITETVDAKELGNAIFNGGGKKK